MPSDGAQSTTNLFTSLSGKTQQEVDAKVKTAVDRFFGIGTGEPNTPTVGSGYRCYYELPNDPSMAFIWAADSNDIRSEGMSYGMMIAVQMDLHAEFDKLWKFAKKYMQYPADTGPAAWKYYFRWQGTVSGSDVTFGATTVPAPDGDEYFAAALYLADKRWGSAGSVSYKQEADNISAALLHNAATADNRYPIFHTTENMVVFVRMAGRTASRIPATICPAFTSCSRCMAQPQTPRSGRASPVPAVAIWSSRLTPPPACTPTTQHSRVLQLLAHPETAMTSSSTTPGAWS